MNADSAHWITPGGPTIESIVPVPGAVVVLSGEEYIDRVDGLVP